MEMLKSIIIGIITWVICCAIEKCWKHLKARINNDNSTYIPVSSPKQFRKMYYISLCLIIAVFVIAINFPLGAFLKGVLISLMIVIIFFNWCAAENLYEMLEHSRKDPKQDNSNDND